MASGIARPAGRKKSPRHEYRGLVDQFPPVRIVDGEPMRFVPGRSRLRNRPRYHRHHRPPASPCIEQRQDLSHLFLSEWAATSSAEDDASGKLSSEIEFLGDGEDVAEINIYGETALADLFDERGINKVSINV